VHYNWKNGTYKKYTLIDLHTENMELYPFGKNISGRRYNNCVQLTNNTIWMYTRQILIARNREKRSKYTNNYEKLLQRTFSSNIICNSVNDMVCCNDIIITGHK